MLVFLYAILDHSSWGRHHQMHYTVAPKPSGTDHNGCSSIPLNYILGLGPGLALGLELLQYQ